jgi:hypothetical protein
MQKRKEKFLMKNFLRDLIYVVIGLVIGFLITNSEAKETFNNLFETFKGSSAKSNIKVEATYSNVALNGCVITSQNSKNGWIEYTEKCEICGELGSSSCGSFRRARKIYIFCILY